MSSKKPSHQIRFEDPDFAPVEVPEGDSPAFHLDVGTQDHDRMVRMSRAVREALDRRGWPVEYHERPGGHDWEYVDAALPASLEFLSRNLTGVAEDSVVPRP